MSRVLHENRPVEICVCQSRILVDELHRLRTRETYNLSRRAHVGHIQRLLTREILSPLIRRRQCCGCHFSVKISGKMSTIWGGKRWM